MNVTNFQYIARHLSAGDFSLLDPVFTGDTIIDLHRSGAFDDQPAALAEALTCASFLGRNRVVEYLLTAGVDPAGGSGTGLNAITWAANRGEPAAVELLLKHGAPLETRSMYDGTPLGGAVWSAINEPRADQVRCIELLLEAGADVSEAEYPTGNGEIDAILVKYIQA